MSAEGSLIPAVVQNGLCAGCGLCEAVANPGVITPISQHYRMFVPNEAAINPVSGTNWERVGVAPDVAVAAEQSLATAHRLALEALLIKADTAEKPELEEARAALGK